MFPLNEHELSPKFWLFYYRSHLPRPPLTVTKLCVNKTWGQKKWNTGWRREAKFSCFTPSGVTNYAQCVALWVKVERGRTSRRWEQTLETLFPLRPIPPPYHLVINAIRSPLLVRLYTPYMDVVGYRIKLPFVSRGTNKHRSNPAAIKDVMAGPHGLIGGSNARIIPPQPPTECASTPNPLFYIFCYISLLLFFHLDFAVNTNINLNISCLCSSTCPNVLLKTNWGGAAEVGKAFIMNHIGAYKPIGMCPPEMADERAA